LPPAELGDTIFDELRPWGDVAPAINTQQMEHLFAPAIATQGGKGTGAATEPGAGQRGRASSSSAANPVANFGSRQGGCCLLDATRAQNLAIMLRQVPVSMEELVEMLRWMRLSHPISAESLEHIQENMLPTLLQSVEVFKNYSGPLEALRDVERSLMPLARLPRLKARLQSLRFGKTMPTVHAGLLARINALREACGQVRDSGALRRVLGTVLRVGNYLNHGVDAPDAGGGAEARGFTLESLLRLRDFRASSFLGGGEGTASALHCVALHLQPTDPRLMAELKNELHQILTDGSAPTAATSATPCDITSSFVTIGDLATAPMAHPGIGSIADLRDAVSRFRTEAELVQAEAERFGECYRLDRAPAGSDGPGPLATLNRLAEDAQEMASMLEEKLSEALASALSLLEYFGDRRTGSGAPASAGADPAAAAKEDAAVERFFAVLREFVQSFDECWRELLDHPRRYRFDPPPHASSASVATTNGAASTTVPSAADKTRSVAAVAAAAAAGGSSNSAERQRAAATMNMAAALGAEAASSGVRRRRIPASVG
jgi:hypothetical protein